MHKTTLVVIGGGVIGLSTAYQLARKKAGRIVLIDQGRIGDGASSRAAGIGTLLLWSETGVRARQIGFQLFREFSAEWDNYSFHNEHGCLNLFAAETWSEKAALLPLYHRLGVACEVLDASEIHRRWPALNPPEDCLALHDPQGGYSEPAEYLSALTKQVEQLGVEILPNEPVVEFLRRGERVVGVRTPRQSIEADAVISTVHVWSLPLWQELDLRLPMKHFVHQRYVTMPLPQPWVAPPINMDPYSGYLRPAKGNRVLMGIETSQREEFRVTTRDFQMNQLTTPIAVRDEGHQRFLEFAPVLKHAAWESEHIGLISFSGDGEPILGPVSQLPGLFVAASFHSGGFSYNSAAGLLMAELVLDGNTSIDITSFSPNRFDSADTDQHLSKTVTQSQAVRRRH